MQISRSLFEKFLEDRFGDDIVKQGDEWILPSFENPSKQKLYVNVDKQTAIDFIGGQGYSAFSLIAKILGTYPGKETEDFIVSYALKNLKHVDLNGMFKKPEKIEKKSPPIAHKIPLPDGCIDVLGTSIIARQARNYLYNRGLNDNDIRKYHLMFCTQGRFKNRIIIPFIENGEMIWYQGRAIYKWMDRFDNPSGVEKSMLVFNIDAIDKLAVISEGPFDAMTVNGQAIMGSRLSEWQAMKIVAKRPEKIVLVPDEDWNGKICPGYDGALKSVEKLAEQGYPLKSVLIAFLEGGKDLNALGKKEAFRQVLDARPFDMVSLVRLKQYGAKSEYLERNL